MTLTKLNPTCANCLKVFESVFPKQKYCCVPCAFWANVEASSGPGCWGWKGSVNSFGYGEFRYQSNLIRAHRYSYELHYGPIPEALSVLHGCDNPRCCRPLHLSIGTQADNMKDVAVRYRGLKVLTIEQAKYAEARLLAGIRICEIAREIGVTHPTISGVRNRMRRMGVAV